MIEIRMRRVLNFTAKIFAEKDTRDGTVRFKLDLRKYRPRRKEYQTTTYDLGATDVENAKRLAVEIARVAEFA